jgi:type I restriction enzyme S subunit
MITFDEAKIRDVADVKGGKRLPKGKQLLTTPNSHPYIRIRDLGKSKILELNSDYEYVDSLTQESIKRYIVSEGDILISVVGTIGLIGIVGKSLHGANQTENCDKITNLKRIDRDYLYYYLKSDMGQNEIKKGTVGAVQPKLPLKNVLDLKIKYPDIDTQRKIAKILNLIDGKITINNEINDNLQQQVKTMYEDMFLDVTLDCLPVGYKIVPLYEIADVLSGKRPVTRVSIQDETNKYPLVGAASIMGYTNNYNFNCKILVTGRVGTHGVIQRFSSPCWASDNTLIITSNYYEFTSQFLQHIDYDSMNRGSTQPLITQSDLKKQQVIIPDTDKIQSFEKFAEALMKKYDYNILQNEKLSDLRDSLLPKLMSGEIDVDSIEL